MAARQQRHRVIGRVAAHQVRSLLRQGVVVTVIALVFLAGICALLVDWRNYVEADRLRAAAEQHQRVLWEHLDVGSAHSAAHVGTLIFRPLPPEAIVDSGLLPFAGSAMILRAHSQGELDESPVANAPYVPEEGFLSLATVMEVLLPLLLAVCVAPVLVEERESGLARLLVTQGLPRSAWIVGSLAGRALPAFALLTLFFAAAALCLLGMAGLHAASVAAPRMLLLFLWHGTMLLIVALLFGAISLCVKTLRMSLILSLCLCAWWTVIGPRMVQAVMSRLAPLPTRAELEARTERDMTPLNGKNYFKRYDQLVAQYLAKYHVTRKDDLPVNPGGFLLEQYEALGARVAGLRFAEVLDAEARQLHGTEWMGLLDLRSAVRAGSMRLAGSGLEDLRHFDEEAEAYRFHMVQRLNEDQKFNIPGASYREMQEHFRERREALFRGIAPFREDRLPLHASMRSMVRSGTVLLLWTVGALLAMCAAANRLREVGL